MERVDRQRRRAGPSRCGIHFADRSATKTNGSTFRKVFFLLYIRWKVSKQDGVYPWSVSSVTARRQVRGTLRWIALCSRSMKSVKATRWRPSPPIPRLLMWIVTMSDFQQRGQYRDCLQLEVSSPYYKVSRSEPAFGEVSSLLGLDDDVEWREMTEEEESLALEEHSLNLEIEHVCISIISYNGTDFFRPLAMLSALKSKIQL